MTRKNEATKINTKFKQMNTPGFFLYEQHILENETLIPNQYRIHFQNYFLYDISIRTDKQKYCPFN